MPAAAIAAGVLLAFIGPVFPAIVATALLGLASIRYPTPLFAWFLYLGVFKGEPALRDLPVDLTAVTAGLLALICLFRALTGRVRRLPPVLVLGIVVLALSMLIGLSWTTDPVYGREKVIFFITLTTLATLAPFFLFETRRDLFYFFGAIVVLALAAAVYALISDSSFAIGRLALGESRDTISTGRLLAAGGMVLILLPARSARARLVGIAAGSGLFVLVLAVGSRGAIVAFVLGLCCVGLAQLYRGQRLALTILASVTLVGLLLVAVPLPYLAAERVEEAARDPVGAFAGGPRHASYNEAVRLIREHPIRGVGPGGFASLTGVLPDTLIYPHNLFLELWAELGAHAALLVAALVGYVLVQLYRRGRADQSLDSRILALITGLFLLTLFAAQFSSDINGNRPFWALLGLSWLAASGAFAERRSRTASSRAASG